VSTCYLLIERRIADDLPLGLYHTLEQVERVIGMHNTPALPEQLAELFALTSDHAVCHLVIKFIDGEPCGGWFYGDEKTEFGYAPHRTSSFADPGHDELSTQPGLIF